ncbi:MAG: hypothetical protein ACRDLD_15310 [Thermoleophilaceae bacterium]
MLFSVGDVPAAQRKRHRLCGNERAHATEQQHEKEANRLHAAYYDPP